MAPKSQARSAAFDYFLISNDGKHYICQCNKEDSVEQLCAAKMSTNSDSKSPNLTGKTSNLKRYLQRFHPKIYELVIKKDSTVTASAKSQKSYIAKKVVPLTNFFESRKVTVNMTSSKFRNCIIEMVVRNSIPISFFSKPAFISINGEMAEKLSVPLHRDIIRNIVIEEATRQKQELKNTLKNCFLFLKMDGCTRHRVNFLSLMPDLLMMTIELRLKHWQLKIFTQTTLVDTFQISRNSFTRFQNKQTASFMYCYRQCCKYVK